MKQSIHSLIIILLCLTPLSICHAVDVIYWNHGNKDTDKRRDYKAELITQALEKTVPEYGHYRLIESPQEVVPQRALQQLQLGKSINIFMAVTSPEWEEKTIPIRIPIRRGILNYRLLAMNKKDVPSFSSVRKNEDLKEFTVGLGRSWATVALLEKYNYPIIQATSLNGLYEMLLEQKIDYIPRGINEAFDEQLLQRSTNKNLVIEPTLALHTQAPYYIFVSPSEKRIASRLEAGLEMMIADKSLQKLFYKYYADKLARADLKKRKIIHLDNPLLSTATPLTRKELWFEYDNEFTQ